MKVRDIPLEKLFIKNNIRTDTDDELGEQISSMAKIGQLQPIGVFPRGDRFEIVFGHRRFRAAQMNNEPTIACHILENVSESDIPIIKLQENMVRKQLTNAEILAAVSAIQAKNPGLTLPQIDAMMGKRRGWIGWRRSLANAYQQLADAGLDQQMLSSLSDDELTQLRARMKKQKAPARGNRGAFNRPTVPEEGFRVVNSPGPNVVVICANKTVKLQVLKSLRELQR
jgi:ParB-like chromosome segregation protein Spo0J